MKCATSAIPWCDYGSSPVTGCQHGCRWCYARSMVRRYGAPDAEGLHVLDAPIFAPMDPSERAMPYPFGFAPTLHRYRLDAPAPRKPGRVLVCPMADLWGSWVPGYWQDEVLGACAEAPHHDYLFLTKHPAAYRRVDWRLRPWAWLGATATDLFAYGVADAAIPPTAHVRFLSMEPWLDGGEGLDEVQKSLCGGPEGPDWLILGPLTGPGSSKANPVSRDAVLRLRDTCERRGVVLFIKPSATAWGLTPGEIAGMQSYPLPHPSAR